MADNKQEILTPNKNNTILQTQNYFIQKLSETFTAIGENMNENQKRVGMNSIIAINDLAQKYDKTIYDFNPANVYAVLQKAIGNELDPNNDEIAFIPQWTTKKIKDPITNVTTEEKIFGVDTRRTAKGDVSLVRRRATGIDIRNPFKQQFTVYEGDEFTDISFNGADVTPPQYSPKHKSKKVLHVVWGLNMLDGTVRWVVGSRIDAKASIIAQAVNNGAPFEETQKMWDLSVDEILEKYINATVTKEYSYGNKKYTKKSFYFNDTWRANQNREGMMETKIRGYMAARMVDISFNNVIEKQAFEDLIIEDKYIEKPNNIEENADDLITKKSNMIDAEFDETTEPTTPAPTDKRSIEEVPEFVEDETIIEDDKKTPENAKVEHTTGEIIENEIAEEEQPEEDKEIDDLFSSGFGL